MNYIEYTFDISSSGVNSDVLIALLDHSGFSGFFETEKVLYAYVSEKDEGFIDIKNIISGLGITHESILISREVIHEQNWNSLWEKSFQPVNIDNQVFIRAPFHTKSPKIPLEMVIEPKMSFGTGHHDTTMMMIRAMLNIPIKDSKVLDVGCGTGILSIFAALRGARSITAVDIDSWAIENTVENLYRNQIESVDAFQGTIADVKEASYNIILANINTNVILNDLTTYYRYLKPEGTLVLSGIMTSDIGRITLALEKMEFRLIEEMNQGNWHLFKLTKPH